MRYDTVLREEEAPLGSARLNRPEDGYMFTVFTETLCHEVRDSSIHAIGRETRARDRLSRAQAKRTVA